MAGAPNLIIQKKKKKQVGLLLNNIIMSLFCLFSGVSLLESLCGGEFL